MSLAKLRKLDERGVVFQSHIDGSRHELTPERAMEIQALLGSDIQMQLDECVRLPCSHEEAERAMRLSLRWAERSRRAFAGGPGQAVFGIVQGGVEQALRVESARALAEMDFHGLAIGGLAVGEPQAVMLDDDRDGRAASAAGKAALSDGRRHARRSPAGADARRRHVRLRDADPRRPARPRLHPPRPHEPARTRASPTIRGRSTKPRRRSPRGDFSRAYLRHLVKSGEILGMMALTAVNLAYYQELMAGARAAIAAGRLADYVARNARGLGARRGARAPKSKAASPDEPETNKAGAFAPALYFWPVPCRRQVDFASVTLARVARFRPFSPLVLPQTRRTALPSG